MYEYSQDTIYHNKPMDFPTEAVAIGFVRVMLDACIVKIQLEPQLNVLVQTMVYDKGYS
jgi:hypothetical protein